jgi:hypothetical protein
MTTTAPYGDTRTFDLPDGWKPVAEEVLTVAAEQTLAALAGDSTADRVAKYYDREGPYAGTLFLDAQPNDPNGLDAADLYAITTLSIKLDPRHGRLLLDPGPVREQALRQLRNLNGDLPITDLTHGLGGSAETLTRMYELHHRLKTLLDENSNRWVTAAKLCARKRPRLFPVRDNLVCEYLSGGRNLTPNDGWPGDFSTDIQIFAYLVTHPTVISRLSWLRAELTSVRLDEDDLRLLDSALWMAASQ